MRRNSVENNDEVERISTARSRSRRGHHRNNAAEEHGNDARSLNTLSTDKYYWPDLYEELVADYEEAEQEVYFLDNELKTAKDVITEKDDEIARLPSQLENVDTTLRESLEACQVSKVSIISSQGWSQSLRVWR